MNKSEFFGKVDELMKQLKIVIVQNEVQTQEFKSVKDQYKALDVALDDLYNSLETEEK